MAILGITLSLILLIVMAYRGFNVILLAPLLAIMAVAFEDGNLMLASYTQIFLPALGKYFIQYFPVFLLGSIFGKLIEASGAAQTIGFKLSQFFGARHAILAVAIACAILTYGGVSLFVVAFCMYPIATELFTKAQIPRRLIPGTIALGAFTFTMTALPGSPAIQNAIPMPIFGTTVFAAPGIGIIASILLLSLGMLWLRYRASRAHQMQEPFDVEQSEATIVNAQASSVPLWKAITPLLLVLILNYLLSRHLIDQWDVSYLAQKKFGEIGLGQVRGIWSLILSLFISALFFFALIYKTLPNPIETLNKATMGSLLPIMNTASEVGFGAVIASLSAYTIIKTSILSIAPDQPLISLSVAVNILSGITGSASGGLSIALESLGSHYLQLAQQLNISPELLHRVATLSCGGLDTLPHNGAVISLLTICGLTHKKAYFDIFVIAVAIPVVVTIATILLGTFFGSF